MVFCCHGHNAGQHGGTHATGGAVVSFAHRFEQVADAAAVQSGDKVHAGEVDEAQTEVEGFFHLLSHFLAQAIPFVDHDNQGTTAVKDKAQQRQILIGDTFTGINDQHHHVGVFNRLQRLDD